MLKLAAILSLRFLGISDRNKAAWHGVHAWFAFGEFVYHGALALTDYLDHRKSRPAK